MKILSLGCKTIQDGLTTASIFFSMGLGLILAGIWIIPQILYLPQIIIISGTLLLIMVPLILIATYLKNR